MDIRDTLFGDLDLATWSAGATQVESSPGRQFVEARKALAVGGREHAIDLLTAISRLEGLESRQYLEAWHALRGLGIEPPPDVAKHVYGVVLEVALEEGVDLLAAYADRSARYYNYSGAGVVWDSADASLNAEIEAVLAAGNRIAATTERWQGRRPERPPEGNARINVLTPSGLRFGEAKFKTLTGDPVAGPAIAAATALMQKLIVASKQRRAP